MKKSFLTAVLFTLMIANSLPMTARAQEEAPPDAGQQAPGQHQQSFERHKAALLQRISDHIADLQKRQSCVQAAVDPQSLRSCAPQRPDHGPEQGGERSEPSE